MGIIISGSVVFAISFEFPSKKEHYEIKITGLKDVYLVGEPYSLSYTISGYGYACANREITYPNENGDTVRNNIDVDCNTGVPRTEFVIDSKDESHTKSIAIKNSGRYNVSVMFEKSTGIEPTQAFDGFHVVEKICDDSNPKDRAQCFADAFGSCTSSFAEFVFPTGEGDGIIVTGIVESWNDCNLRVYTDRTQDRYKRDSSGTRSICDGIMIDDESISFENCNNEEIPPLRFDQQYYLYKERCEIFGGWWNFEYDTCFDFSDEYDCQDMGGKLVSRGYTYEQPDYSKKSDSFACEFGK